MSSSEMNSSRRSSGQNDSLAFEVRWSATLNRWHDAHGLCNGATHQRVELVVRVSTSGQRAMTEAMLQWPDGRRDLLHAQTHECAVSRIDGMVHVDIASIEQRLLAVSIDARGQLLYAQTGLFQSAGLASAAFDPPRLLHIACAASADDAHHIGAAVAS